MGRYTELSDFATAFAKEYKGFMVATGLDGQTIAKKLGRSTAYVSERVNGKRALDTEDVDALAMLVGNGWTGRTLMIELARRARAHDVEELPANVTRLPHNGANLTAVDLMDDAGVVEYDGRMAADRGDHLADGIPAADEDPEPDDTPND